MASTALIIVSLSHHLAHGVCEIIAPLAPDVTVKPCQLVGESLSETTAQLGRVIDETVAEVGPQTHLIMLTDLGSATLAVQQLLNERGDKQLIFANGPLVEGAVAGAVAAHQGADAKAVARAITGAAQFFETPQDSGEKVRDLPVDPLAPRQVRIGFSDGLTPRPAAVLARMASDYEAEIRINGVDATSVLALMRLGVKPGEAVSLSADGPQARLALTELAAFIEAGEAGESERA